MPDLQTLVSAWTKINQDHVEYFEKDAASAGGGVGGGSSVHSGRSNLSHALDAAGIDPRSPTNYPNGGTMGPSPPPPSGSSLSSVSFSKGTITIPNRQPTPNTASNTSFASAPLVRGGGFQMQQQQQQQQLGQQQAQLPPALMMQQYQQNASRRRSHQSNNHVHGGHNSSSNYHSHINSNPPPQVGADAILGRRKPAGLGQATHHQQHYNFDMAAAMGVEEVHQGEPPASLSASIDSRKGSTTAGGLKRTPSSSLWNSQRSTSVSSVHSSRSSNSVTASLDKMDAAAQAAVAELNQVNTSLTNQGGNFSVSNRSAQRQQPRTTASNGMSPSSSATNLSSGNIFKFNRQKLRKSHSRSDLVREMALDRKRNNSEYNTNQLSDTYSETKNVVRRSSERSGTMSSGSATGSSNTPISSLNNSVNKLVAAAALATEQAANNDNNVRLGSNGQMAAHAFNSQMMMQEWNQSLSMRRQSQSSGLGSSTTPVVSNQNLTADRRMSNLSSQGSNLGAINEQQPVDIGVVNIPAQQQQGSQRHPQKQQQFDPSSNCDRCAQMESAMLSLQADIEYVRTMELQKEFVCRECEAAPTPHAQSVSSAVSVGSKGSRSSRPLRRGSGIARETAGSIASRFSRSAVLLRDASKRLAELSTRHKKESKHSHYERAYWQNDMHLKLEKFAMMCKNLNEEAAQRSNEVKELKSKLEKVTTERNGLVSQVESLKARVGIYEGESVAQSRLRENFDKGEEKALDSFDKAMKSRDETIKDLSNRLTDALEEIERYRHSNSQRRQIIFPPPRTKSAQDAGSAPSSPLPRRSTCSEGEDRFDRDDDITKVAENAKITLEAVMAQCADRELDMQKRLDELETALEQARFDTDDNHLESKMSLNHASSTSSL